MNSRKWCHSGCGVLHPERRGLDSPSKVLKQTPLPSVKYLWDTLSLLQVGETVEKKTQFWRGTQNKLDPIPAERISQELRAGEFNKGHPDILTSFVWLALLKFSFSKTPQRDTEEQDHWEKTSTFSSRFWMVGGDLRQIEVIKRSALK